MNDDEGIEADSRLARSLGFTGKASISPRHVPGINAVFSPTQAEIAYAQEVLAAIDEAKRQGRGAISLHGKMIDAPHCHKSPADLGFRPDPGADWR